MYIIAADANTVAERFHRPGKTGALSFPVYKSSPGRVGSVILPAAPGISAGITQILISGQHLFVLAHSFLDKVRFEGLDYAANFIKFRSRKFGSINRTARIIVLSGNTRCIQPDYIFVFCSDNDGFLSHIAIRSDLIKIALSKLYIFIDKGVVCVAKHFRYSGPFSIRRFPVNQITFRVF